MSNETRYVATIGFFDGVHRGHRHLIEQVRTAAAQRSLSSAVITFPVHPRKVMQSAFQPQLLTSAIEKQQLLAATGIDAVWMMPFTPELSALSARSFMQVLRDEYRVAALVIGYDHRFGHNRTEGFDDYVRYGRELGMEVLPATVYPKCVVSSSDIRKLLGKGDVSAASRLLDYPYFLEGEVVGGHRVGREIGYPTANIRPTDADKLIPADGVYAVRVMVDGQVHGGMLSIGRRPTLNNGTDRSIEVHIFDFEQDVYHQTLRLSFVQYLRPVHSFPSIEALINQLSQDEQQTRALLKNEKR